MLASECATTSAADAAVVVSSSLFNNLDVVRRENTHISQSGCSQKGMLYLNQTNNLETAWGYMVKRISAHGECLGDNRR